MTAKPTRTNGDIYALIDNLRLELKADLRDVSSDVSKLRDVVVNNEIKQAVSATKIGALITGITIVVSGITTVIVERVTGRIT